MYYDSLDFHQEILYNQRLSQEQVPVHPGDVFGTYRSQCFISVL